MPQVLQHLAEEFRRLGRFELEGGGEVSALFNERGGISAPILSKRRPTLVIARTTSSDPPPGS